MARPSLKVKYSFSLTAHKQLCQENFILGKELLYPALRLWRYGRQVRAQHGHEAKLPAGRKGALMEIFKMAATIPPEFRVVSRLPERSKSEWVNASFTNYRSDLFWQV